MRLDTYLSFDGTCREAFTFYAELLGGRVAAMMPFAGSPMCDSVGADERDRIMHGCIVIDGHLLMGTDATEQHPYAGMTGAHVIASVQTPAEAERVFAALADRGTIVMPLQETFWAQRYGMTVDRFGVQWMVNCPSADFPSPV